MALIVVLLFSLSLTGGLVGAGSAETEIQCSEVDCAALGCHELKTATYDKVLSCACCHNDEPQGFLKYIEVSLIPILENSEKLNEITKARNLVINIYEKAKHKVQQISITAAKRAFILSVVIEGVHYGYDIYSAYIKMQQDKARAQDSEDREELENRATEEFKRTIISRTVTAGSILVGAGAGIFLCAATSPVVGGFLVGYGAWYLGTDIGEMVAGIAYEKK